MQITAVKSEDVDNSEILSCRITVFADSFGPIGFISAPTLPQGVAIQTLTVGTYVITAAGDTPDARETKLNSVLDDGIFFQPRPHFSGIFEQGLRIEAISTEQGSLLAPPDSRDWGT